MRTVNKVLFAVAVAFILFLVGILLWTNYGKQNAPEAVDILSSRSEVFNVSGPGEYPRFTKQLIIDPFQDVKLGEKQVFSIWAEDLAGIEQVEAKIKTDKSEQNIFLKLQEGNNLNGKWRGEWITEDISQGQDYEMVLRAVNENSEETTLKFKWETEKISEKSSHLLIKPAMATEIWSSPISGSGSGWNNIFRSYDNNLGTAAAGPDIVANLWSGFLTWNFNEPFTSNKLRFYSGSNTYSDTIDRFDIDVYKNGAWHDVFEGPNTTYYTGYTEKNFAEGSVTQARFRYHSNCTPAGYTCSAHINELQLLNLGNQCSLSLTSDTSMNTDCDIEGTQTTAGGNVTINGSDTTITLKDGAIWTVNDGYLYINGSTIQMNQGSTLVFNQGQYIRVDGYILKSSNSTVIRKGSSASPAPIVSVSANPSSISLGGSTVIDWSSTYAASCAASGAWSGAKATFGSETYSPTAYSTYTLTCTGPGGTGNDSANVVVNTPTPSGSLNFESSTQNSITLSYGFSNGANVSLFRSSTRLTTFSGASGSGTYIDSGLSAGTSYNYYLRNGNLSSSTLLDSVTASTQSAPVTCYNDSECDDGNYCTYDYCYNDGMPSSYCSNPVANRCGDGTCNCGETCSSCATDCGACVVPSPADDINDCGSYGIYNGTSIGNSLTASTGDLLAQSPGGNSYRNYWCKVGVNCHIKEDPEYSGHEVWTGYSWALCKSAPWTCSTQSTCETGTFYPAVEVECMYCVVN